ncbi:hypothetical protein V865_008346 [Kwoniella europaea PYCC6329]|uniref:Major facilitator superfamily (MFS) profile domain-containing protein n=1 Tax=Kwoniella europaea PYCC6329 TaxID=1423913 RepID=A0AAX4KVE5_9TREE
MTFSKWQLAVLLSARVVEPIGYTILFPYVNKMVENLMPDVPKSSVGKYSGAIESTFALSSVLFMYQWGKLSDRIGRKPVILGGLCGVAVTHTLFGMSQSFWWAMVARFLSGALCGNASVMRAVLGEITTKDNEGWVYPLWTVCWDLACVVGPAIGALLQNPATQYPDSWMAKSSFLRKNAYFLPSALIGSMSLLAAVLVLFCLEETNSVCRNGAAVKDAKPTEETPLLTEEPIDAIEALPPAHSFFELVSMKAIQQVLISIFLLTLTAMSFDAGFVLFAYSSATLGGIALSPASIASCLSVKGGMSIAFNLLLFPQALKRVKKKTLYRSFAACWIAVFMLPPVMNVLVLHSEDGGGGSAASGIGDGTWVADGSLRYLWFMMVPLLVLYVFGDLCFPLNMLALNAAAPSASSLGAINGISLITSALARSMGPALFGLLYGVSAERHFPLVWLVFGGIACLSTVQSFRVNSDINTDNGKGVEANGDEETLES